MKRKSLLPRKFFLAVAKKFDYDNLTIWKECLRHYTSVVTEYELKHTKNIKNAITYADEAYPEFKERGNRPPLVFFFSGKSKNIKMAKYFLIGDNIYNIPEKQIIRLDDDGKVDFGNGTKVWVEEKRKNAHFEFATKFADYILITRPIKNKTEFANITGGHLDCRILVKPTSEPSFNNDLIKIYFGDLVDCAEDLDKITEQVF